MTLCLQVSDKGNIVYAFRNDFKMVIRSRSLYLQVQSLHESASRGLAKGVQKAFGAAFLAMILLVFVSIYKLWNINSDNTERNR